MSAPRLLDLFCCEGGAAAGYARAGFEVVGIDLEPRFAKRYPFEFHAADAIEYVKEHGHEFDAIHASPPCQRYSITNAARQHDYPDLIGPTRDALIASGKPWVIENVMGAPLVAPTVLCGSMFGLTATDDDGELVRLERHRGFESNVTLTQPRADYHDRAVQVAGAYGGARRDKVEARTVRHGGYVPAKAVQERLLGIDWMTQHGLFQSLPPVYTEWVGLQLRQHLLATGVAA
ncbi:MAG: DNA cytosine methyltransferase [Rhodoglobus sp.]